LAKATLPCVAFFEQGAQILNASDSEHLAYQRPQGHRTGTMAVNKPRAGEGAKAKILTRMIYPRRPTPNPGAQSTVVLIAEEEREINRRTQKCFTFHVDGDDAVDVCYALTRYVHVLEEGEESKIFDPRLPGPNAPRQKKEKKEKWRKSKAKKILYDLLMDGTITADMALEDIYLLDPEFGNHDFEKFKGRVNYMRKKIEDLDNRADADLEAFRAYKANHKPSLFSHKGYVQWQGSTAQELLWDDLDEYLKDPTKKPKDLWLSREEYRNEFPLDAFRDKIKQEIRTAKYIRTRAARDRGEKT
jgi:hypothetical protein